MPRLQGKSPHERRYGVPTRYFAIWGHETNYGSYTGDFDLARSLATLAYEGRRRELFAEEFVALLKMVDRGVPRYKLKGSWAGAFGNPQFLPSVYLRVATDADGDGLADIWSSRADTLASIGNYLRDAGWRAASRGARVDVPNGFNSAAVRSYAGLAALPQVHARHSSGRHARMESARARSAKLATGRAKTFREFARARRSGRPLLSPALSLILDTICSNTTRVVGMMANAIIS